MQSQNQPWWEVIRYQFTETASWSATLRAGAIVAGVFGLVFFLDRLQRRRGQDVDKPGRLFRDLLVRLGLSRAQRRLLRRLAGDLRLAHPAVMLLGLRSFREATRTWTEQHALGGDERESLKQIEAGLFPAAGPTRGDVS